MLKNGLWKMHVHRGHLTASHSRKQKAERSRGAEVTDTEKNTFPSVTSGSVVTDRKVSLVLNAITLTSNFYLFPFDLMMCYVAGSAINY